MTIENFVKKELTGWTKKEKIFVPAILFSILVISLYTQNNTIGILYVLSGILYTIIAGKGKISCYFFGIIATICYGYLSFSNALYGSCLLNIIYYLPMQIKGIIEWKKHLKSETNEIKKTVLTLKEKIILLLLTIFVTAGLTFILKYCNDNFPLIDALITALSIIGMYLTVKRCIEQWFVWTIVNLCNVIIWFLITANGGKTTATLLMWLIYLFLGIYFFIKWNEEIKKQSEIL